MARSRRRFGPLFWVTAIVALVVAAGALTSRFWTAAQERWTLWTLSRQLGDPAVPARQDALAKLGQLGPSATPIILRALQDSSTVVRSQACWVVPRTAANARQAVPALLVAARDGEASVRSAAILVLRDFVVTSSPRTDATPAGQALRAIRSALGDTAQQVREAAFWFLNDLGALAWSTAEDADRALEGSDHTLRVVAAGTLIKIKAPKAPVRVVAALTPLLAEQADLSVHCQAVALLEEIEGPDALAARLARLLEHESPAIRRRAAYDLVVFRLAANRRVPKRLVVPALVEWAKSRDLAVAALAVEALVVLDPGAARATTSALIEWLKPGHDPELRSRALGALRAMGPEAKAAVSALVELASENPPAQFGISALALEALSKIDPPRAAALAGAMRMKGAEPPDD